MIHTSSWNSIFGTLLTLALSGPIAGGAQPVPAKAPDPQAIEQVQAKQRSEASAAWWGFDPEDATDAVQSAINSNAKTVIIPYMGRPWIVRPIRLASNKEIIFEPGVLVLAKKGQFTGKGDSLFRAADLTDITIRGYGATLRMRKRDYQNPPYEKAEWRMGLSVVGCKRVHVEGLRIESSGGDGIYIGATGKNRWCEDITIRNVVCHDNHRQGISVISAQNLLIENCVLSNTEGTAPQAGIDLEPNRPDERLVNCVIRNCVMANNRGNGILIYLKPLSGESEPVSIRFENCVSRMGEPGQSAADVSAAGLGGHAGIAVGAIKDDGPAGLIEFRNCVSENNGQAGLAVYDKSADAALVRFVNCSWRNPWLAPGDDAGKTRAPLLLHLRRPTLTSKPGGVEFVHCAVHDDVDRPVLQTLEEKTPVGFRAVKGDITLHGPHAPRIALGPKDQSIDIRLHHVNK